MAPTPAVNKLVRDRDSNKKRLNTLKKKADSHSVSPLDLIDTEHYIVETAEIKNALSIIHDKIVESLMEDLAAVATHEEEQDSLLELLSEVSIKLKRIQSKLIPASPTSIGPSDSSAPSTSANAKLPRLVLPTFSGDDTTWISFRDMYIATIHNNPELTKAKKFWYLSTSLKGEASSLINGLAPTDAHYDIAWAKVTGRYENKRQLFFSIMKKFHAIPAASSNDPKSIRTLVDAAQECERALDSLDVLDKWDASIAFHLAQKLDPTSRQFWEMSLDDTDIPNSEQLLEFLEQRARSLQASSSKPSSSILKKDTPKKQVAFAAISKKEPVPTTVSHEANTEGSRTPCKFCSEEHPHYRCSTFRAMTVPARLKAVRKAGLCSNCLRLSHIAAKCFSEQRCRSCGEKHHSMLHPTPAQSTAVAHHASCAPSTSKFEATPSILATAIVQVRDVNGNWIPIRAFLDSGASGQFLTERAVKRLHLPRRPYKVPVIGVSSTVAGSTKGVVSIALRPWFDSHFTATCDAFIVPLVTDKLPTSELDPTAWPHLGGLQLADPKFHFPDFVDLLIGVDLFFDLLQSKKICGPPGTPRAIQTKIGWIVAGAAGGSSSTFHVNHTSLESSIQQFWEIESLPPKPIFTLEEKMAEDHFVKTVTRNESGRYVVEIPFRSPQVNLGLSRESSLRRFRSVERRIHANEKILSAYHEFMKEYEDLGHMKLLTSSDKGNSPFRVFLPHHFILKDEATMAKFRVVFDASAKTSSGFSFNEAQLVGPTIQATLYTTLMRFRCHTVAFTADVAKMYRQILVAPHQQHFQCILWRPYPDQPIQEYQLQTVTYGTASAPFLATRVLRQLADDEKQNFPLASAIAKGDFYVDDCMSGGPTLTQTRENISQLVQMLETAGMSLRKFASNKSEALRDVPPNLRESCSVLSLEEDEVVKALGLHWNTTTDEFFFRVSPFESSDDRVLTKRVLLSEISRLFDPIGWLAPTVICSKILMQDLWKEGTGWDDPTPSHIADQWTSFKSSMKVLEDIRIPRCILTDFAITSELHGFCDASEKAYAAVLYIRARTWQGISSTLLTSKTRVAPTKTISIPRLELCGSLLLAELIESTTQSLGIKFDAIHAWTDSKVVLDWLSATPSRWKTFVANRVSQIQEIIPRTSWSYVSTLENPADCASRGISPEELLSHPLWWSGPSWLQNEDIFPASVPANDVSQEVLQEEKSTPAVISMATTPEHFISRFSSLGKLSRVMGYCVRFLSKLRRSPTPTGSLSPEELQSGLRICVKIIQEEKFPSEMKLLSEKKPLLHSSKLLSLSPFLDDHGILRVGGRLKNADIPEDKKTPVLLPRHHHLTDLIIQDAHLSSLHGGPQLMLAILQEKYWIIRAKDAVRFFVKKCVVCTRHRATLQSQLMGNLPSARVNPSRPFTSTGVDYAGPFLLKTAAPRSKYTFKGYLALFVCFTTRALHLEVVSSLSSDAFLACLKRFVSRRGRPSEIHSDNGTNFVGANREMTEFIQLITSEAHNTIVADHLASQGIKWHFNPPSAPHFGGLWEAGVKSVKFHLHRVVGQARLTFEELSTVVTQVEACLNSRPLTPFSSDPTDLTALTPAHFLIGGPIHAIPEPDFTDQKLNRLQRYHHIQQLVQHFWKRWSAEFITRLQQRPKWMKPLRDVRKDDLVLVKTDGLPPTKWPLARVIEVHPGADGLSRVVTLRTQVGELKRPIVKTVLLPIEESPYPLPTE